MASDLRSELPSGAADAATVVDSTNPTDPKVTARPADSSPTAPIDAGGEIGELDEAAADRAELNLVSDIPSSDVAASKSQTETSEELSAAETSRDSERRGVPIWLALIGLVIATLVVGHQMRLNGQLEAEITGLEAKLGRTEAVLGAHKSHLGDIRGGVRDLAAQLQSLQSLVETEPVAARDARSDRSE